MKIKNFIYFALFGALSAGFVSCSDDNNHGEEPAVPTTVGYYILNRGNYSANNSNIAYYDEATQKLTTDYYKLKNSNKDLGSDAEQIFQYGSKIYISVTSSNKIVVLDLEGNQVGELTPMNLVGQPMNPRCFTAMNGDVYVSYFYGSAIGVIDTTTITEKNVIDLGVTAAGASRYPEQLTVANGKIYVALSEYGKGKTVGVVDPSAGKLTKEIEVVINPCNLQAGKDGNVYVISLGDYGDIKNTLQVISKDDKVTTLGNGSKMTVVGDYLYVVYAQWGEPVPSFFKYDASSSKLVTDKLIPYVSTLTDANSIDVDPIEGNIYVSNAPYGETASMYVFDKEGTQVGQPFGTGGYDTQKVLFITSMK